MTFDSKSVEVICVTLPNDHCDQVQWEYINVCGYNDQFYKMTTYYIQRTYNVLQLVPIKTLQSLHAKLRTINESFETNFDCTKITRD